MGSDGNPAWQRVYKIPEKASVLFHFRRNEENTHYFPTVKHGTRNWNFSTKELSLSAINPLDDSR
jgi:hypothetical protein